MRRARDILGGVAGLLSWYVLVVTGVAQFLVAVITAATIVGLVVLALALGFEKWRSRA